MFSLNLLSRRTALGALSRAALGAVCANLPSICSAQDGLPPGIGLQLDFAGPLPPREDRGIKPAELAELRTAEAIIGKVPTGGSPIDIATFFLDVGKGIHGNEWIDYVKGWPVRWNPVIVEFFGATSTKPSGDLTPWCAAFANWCIQRATGKPATRSASSGSFRTFGKVAKSPRAGDLVVFQSTDSARSSAGRGHVGFFVRDEPGRILVLGGNQIRQGNHMINETWFSKRGQYLALHSIRADPKLHV